VDRELHFLPEYGCYAVRWTSNLSGESLVAHWRDIVERPEFKPDFAALHDLRGVEVRPGKQGAVEVGEIYRRDVEPRVGFGRAAILVASADAFDYAVHLVELLELEGALIGYDEREAKAWVGLPRDFTLPYPSPE